MRKYIFPMIFLGLFVLIDYVFTNQLDKLGAYASYIAEAILILVVSFFYRSRINIYFHITKPFIIQLPLALVGGYLVYKFALTLHLIIPFDFNNHETILLLLLVAPILEEGLFRHALWLPLEDIFGQTPWVIISTTLIFAWGHFFAYFFVPESLHLFVIFQTVYVAIIGLWWAIVRNKKGSIMATIPLHMLFNLGFYLGFLCTR